MFAFTNPKTLSLCFLVSTTLAGPLSSRGSDLPEGYTEAPVEWELKAHPDGETFAMNGTVEQVHAELVERNPNYRRDFDLDNDLVAREDDSPLSRRDKCDDDWSRIDCDIERAYATVAGIEEGVKYLRDVPGKPSLGAGPGKCGRVSCSDNSGIWWCNDYDRGWQLKSYNSIANGAQCVLDKCPEQIGFPGTMTRGQTWANGAKWTVMVHHPRTSC